MSTELKGILNEIDSFEDEMNKALYDIVDVPVPCTPTITQDTSAEEEDEPLSVKVFGWKAYMDYVSGSGEFDTRKRYSNERLRKLVEIFQRNIKRNHDKVKFEFVVDAGRVLLKHIDCGKAKKIVIPNFVYGTCISEQDISEFDATKDSKDRLMVLTGTSRLKEVESSGMVNINGLFSFFSGGRLDLKRFDTSKVESMAGTFMCSKLYAIDGIERFCKVSNKTLLRTFYMCRNFDSLNLENWDVSNVSSLRETWAGCDRLVEVKLETWRVNKVRSLNSAFFGCKSIRRLDLSDWVTESLEDLTQMTELCVKLEELLIGGFVTKHVVSMARMCAFCYNLVIVDLSSFSGEVVTDTSYMFYNCEHLESAGLNGLHAPLLESTKEMFSGCLRLRYVNIHGMTLTGRVNAYRMFQNCPKLKKVACYYAFWHDEVEYYFPSKAALNITLPVSTKHTILNRD